MDVGFHFRKIQNHWLKWASQTNAKHFVIGISGGKDSTVVATLAAKLFGSHNVIGVFMPPYSKEDYEYAKEVVKELSVFSYNIDITKSVNSLYDNFIVDPTMDAEINLPARIRMATLFLVAQTFGARVLNTCNLSENMVGYSTLFGDSAGTYAPIHDYTVSEVIDLGRWLGIPEKFLVKPPSDGLCGKTDEENLGVSYKDIDSYIRHGDGDPEVISKIVDLYEKNRFKLELINVPHPNSGLVNYLID